MSGRSIVEWFAEHEAYRCGYCGTSDTNFSHGMWAHTMTCQDYQDLIDRGWRRSGKYVYKPTMNQTCCPQYTIKCAALQYRPSRSQKKVIKKVAKLLVNPPTGSKPGEQGGSDSQGPSMVEDVPDKQPSNINVPQVSSDAQQVSSDVQQVSAGAAQVKKSGSSHESQGDVKEGGASCEVDKPSSSNKVPRAGEGPDPSKPPCKKAKFLRKQRKQEKEALRQSAETAQNLPWKKERKEDTQKSLEDFLKDEALSRLEMRLVRSEPNSEEFSRTRMESYELYKKYQIAIHKDEPDKCTMKQWTRFLVDSPLQEEHKPGLPACGNGSFHQQYWLDGKLIAVGVLDILPSCVSSVYLYYDPDYHYLSLGTYSALREISLTRQLHETAPRLEYYYMGFYIHTCPKMKYKGNYDSSFLLCPEVYSWVPVEKCRPKLDASNYARLEDPGKADENGNIDVNRVLVLYEQQLMPYAIYRAITGGSDEDDVRLYATLAGRTCAERIILFRN
ncbi:PREDICTED: arginyl-tRNA--protein transferase 1-like [Branchiostoma belcheri]|uniref:Arginyl-tRNA--protein transferase 1 n=1 Tax=Branchiostoma belcheri TaxID=7741 RepID=A0A6P4ZR89_BRABE|nr:PREDICTED: arginyl-tRNA--protein transferase 1-like [Branchiostoma belcheri]